MSVKKLIPPPLWLNAKIIKRMVEDMPHSISFVLNPWKKNQALQELELCRNIADYLAFTRRWLGVGSVQIPWEIEAAVNCMATESPRYICEIGTECGGTNILLSQTLSSVELMIGIDLYVKNRLMLGLLHRPSQQIHLINGSSYTSRTVHRLESILNGRKLDVLFIDGDHRYESVKKDFLMYKHLVRESGFIMFHDIVPDHAVRYGKMTRAYSGGVPLIWEQLKKTYPSREFIQNPEQDGMGIGVIKYSSSIGLPANFIDEDMQS